MNKKFPEIKNFFQKKKKVFPEKKIFDLLMTNFCFISFFDYFDFDFNAGIAINFLICLSQSHFFQKIFRTVFSN